MGMLSRQHKTNMVQPMNNMVPERPVDEDVAQFMQRMKNLNARCETLENELRRTQATLAESERRSEFLEKQLERAALDRDVYNHQYITLHTELNRLVKDAEHFRNCVVKALNHSVEEVRKYGTEAKPLDKLSDDEAKEIEDLAAKLGAGNDPS